MDEEKHLLYCAECNGERIADPIQRSIDLFLSETDGRDRQISNAAKVNGQMHYGGRPSAVRHQPQRKLSHDIEVEILSWLPAKSLLRFRVACRAWDAAAGDPFVAWLHLSRQRPHRSLIVRYDSWRRPNRFTLHLIERDHDRGCTAVSNIKPVKLDDRPEYDLVGSCNGLLCLFVHGFEGADLYVYNPLLGELSKLPEPITPRRGFQGQSYGFGFVPARHEFKVTRLVTKTMDDTFLEVCTLPVRPGGRWSWRTAPTQLLYHLGHSFSYPTFHALVNGKLHWIAQEYDQEDGEDYHTVVSFDLAEERIEEVPCVEAITRQHPPSIIIVAEIDGCLAAMINSRLPGFSGELWVMREYGKVESWTRLLSLMVSPTRPYPVWTPSVSINGEILLFYRRRSNLMAYNTASGQLYVYDTQRFHDRFDLLGVSKHAASLASPKALEEQ